eukprot:gnl/TRDRNA2_/TRDRNA2_35934_c0_seq1.p1 gnl/TRDRNA2_/TRDRNA2_35934_c0~~gnl/TRDRNA2_/TRDRNA2_35934_c0_seq1.p1  ORF type:complete len:413 (+),score=49.87 gnl/TRDRNA2_/TRDRNA2_35934_c0_seq1:55-1239(+)
METALRYALKHYFEEWAQGLDNINSSQYPYMIHNLRLKPQKFQEEMDEDGKCPFKMVDGTIASIQLMPSFWNGTLQVVATGITMNFTFSTLQALQNALEPDEPAQPQWGNQYPGYGGYGQGGYGQNGYPTGPPRPMGPPPAPRFCPDHDESSKRQKGEPYFKECAGCNQRVQTNYLDFKYCPSCSDQMQVCTCCGAKSTTGGPAKPGVCPPCNPNDGPPPQHVFCGRHSTSEQRPKVEPEMRECQDCRTQLKTNYADFALCPHCSARTNRCMCCAAPADDDGGQPNGNTTYGAPSPPPMNGMGPGPRSPSHRGGSMALPPPPPPPKDNASFRNSRPSGQSVQAPPRPMESLYDGSTSHRGGGPMATGGKYGGGSNPYGGGNYSTSSWQTSPWGR